MWQCCCCMMLMTLGNAVFVIETDPSYSPGGFQQIVMNRPRLPIQIVAQYVPSKSF